MRSSKRLSLFLVLAAVFFIAPVCFAADIFQEPASVAIAPSQKFQLTFFLRSEDSINAIETKIRFPADVLDLKEIREGNSLVSFWVEKPSVVEPGVVSLSGIIPGGFSGPKGPLIALIFQAKKEGKGSIRLESTKILLNDGAGTQTPAVVQSVPVLVQASLGTVSSTLDEQLKDSEPPESFPVEIVQDMNIADGKRTAIFSTTDKGSGIDHYDLVESREKIMTDALDPRSWQRVESPVVLREQVRGVYVYVRAVDRQGNERIAVYEPPKMSASGWWPMYGILVLIVVIALFIFFRKKKKTN
ncbi:MAG: cohesin domain-containing protein [bacterium]|nr:cohesin domain-containing protein [bacterium]